MFSVCKRVMLTLNCVDPFISSQSGCNYIHMSLMLGKFPIHVNLNNTVFYVSEVSRFCLLSPTCMFMEYQCTSGHYLPVDMSFYYVIPFTMYAVIVQMHGIDTFCMSEAVMQLVAGTLCYENIVMHIMRMVFHSNVESYKLMPGKILINVLIIIPFSGVTACAQK